MWCNDYVPDLTERYPEGFGGADIFEPYDPEYAMWEAMERDYYDSMVDESTTTES